MMAIWTFDVTRGRAGLEELQLQWDELARRERHLAFHQCAAWAGAYLDHLAPDGDALLFVSARRDGALALVLVLERLHGRVLRLLKHDHLVLSDVLAPDCDATVWPLLWAWLCGPQGPGCRRLELPALAADATLAHWLQACPPALVLRRDLEGSARLDVNRPYAGLLKAASASHRSNIVRGRKRALGMGQLRYETHVGPGGMAAALDHFLAVEVSGWKGRSGGAVACRPELMAFYAQLAAIESAHASCEIDLLWLDKQVIATVFWLRCGVSLQLQKIAYREELGEFGPGRLILAEALQRACADPTLQQVSFITRCSWADGWRTQIVPVHAWELRPGTLVGRIAHLRAFCVQAAKRWLRPLLQRWRTERLTRFGVRAEAHS
ncbi:MAG: hypothetical protein RIQ60_3063 [Pseudomonadota bacterium]|jgi:CelD/BcsL family acetyltransferase involved in cellulose biosynthesis